MKSKYKYLLFLLAAIAMSGTFVGCTDDESAAPSVDYVRITRPESSDSLLVAAGQGQMIAIIGSNLQNVSQVWFNDLRATLNATFVSSNSIITRIPSDIPTEITNQMKLVTSDGQTLLYDFTVDISKPAINYILSEYVGEGEEGVIYGNYFYEPIQIMLTGGVEAEIVSVEDDEIHFKVPAGAQPGPITIRSNFGEIESDFWLNDNRNIIANFEGPFANGFWRGGDFVVDSDPNIPNINGKFMRVNRGALSAWPYLEIYGGPSDGDVALLTKVIPEEAFLKPEAYSLKFEINTLAAITGANMRLYLGPAPGSTFGDARNNIYYVWQPNLNTNGKWQTVTIPWAVVFAANRGNDVFNYNANGYGMYIYFHGPNAANYNFGADNFRVVPTLNED